MEVTGDLHSSSLEEPEEKKNMTEGTCERMETLSLHCY